jgi:hypothetical protein
MRPVTATDTRSRWSYNLNGRLARHNRTITMPKSLSLGLWCGSEGPMLLVRSTGNASVHMLRHWGPMLSLGTLEVTSHDTRPTLLQDTA